MDKKDLKHLSRGELIDLIYELKKSDINVDAPSFSELIKEPFLRLLVFCV